MGPFDDIVSGMQNFARGEYGTNALSNLTGMGLAMTGNDPNTQTQKLQGQAMADIQRYVDKNQGNIARGVIEWSKSPEAVAVHKIPGAFEKVLGEYQKAMTPLPMQAAGVPSNQTGAYQVAGEAPTHVQAEPNIQNAPVGSQPYVTRPGVGGPGSATPGSFNPQQPNVTPVPPGYGTAVTQQGQSGVQPGPRNQTAEIQNFEHFAQGLDTQTLDLMKGYKAGGDAGQKLVMASILAKRGLPQPLIDNFLMGNIRVTQDPKRPAIWNWEDTLNQPGVVHPFIPQIPGIGGTGGLGSSSAPSWTNNLNPPPSHDISSSPGFKPEQNTPVTPGPGSSLNAQQAHTLAAKYHVYDDAIRPDGKINPVNKAWGPQGGLALGGGLPALYENMVGHISRWFDPSQTNERAQAISDAEQGLQALDYLATGLGASTAGRTLKDMIDTARNQFPGHEKWDDPQYSIMQFQKARSLLSMERDMTNNETASAMINGGASEDQIIRNNNEKVFAIAKVLHWLPSDETLQDELRALRDGKLANVPSLATAAGVTGEVAKTTAKHAGKALGLISDKPEELNADADGTIASIRKMPVKEITNKLIPMWNSLNPNIQQAITDRINGVQSKPAGKASQFGPDNGKPQGPSVQQFTQNPTGHAPVKNLRTKAANPFEAHAPTSFGSKPSPFGSGAFERNPDLTPNQDRIDNAFRAYGQ